MIERFGAIVHGFDPTPKSTNWIATQALDSHFRFHQVGLADLDGELTFQPPINPNFASYSAKRDPSDSSNVVSLPVKRLRTLMDELEIQELDVLKMDIEGCEYDVINDMLDSEIRPRQLLVEFHDQILNMGFGRTLHSYNRLVKAGYSAFDISDTGNEFSFVFDP